MHGLLPSILLTVWIVLVKKNLDEIEYKQNFKKHSAKSTDLSEVQALFLTKANPSLYIDI